MAAGGSKVNEVKAFEQGCRLDFGKMGHGCKHYRRRCRIRAPCCNELFGCRHCHNEATDDRHEVPRHEVQRVICLICDTEQPAEKACLNCGVNMGEYSCSVCKFYDDAIDKQHYHCDHCGICRVGGRENFFHCQKCGCCYSRQLLNRHVCVENSLRHNCPVCYEYLFDSLKVSSVLQCGHTLHSDCLMKMRQHRQYTCPICSKVIDAFGTWKELENELMESTAASEVFRQRKAWILCNDCKDTTEGPHHAAIGVKCIHCYSYNTRKIAPSVLPQ